MSIFGNCTSVIAIQIEICASSGLMCFSLGCCLGLCNLNLVIQFFVEIAAMTSLKDTVEALKEIDQYAELLVRLLSVLPGWNEKNIQVFRKSYFGMNTT